MALRFRHVSFCLPALYGPPSGPSNSFKINRPSPVTFLQTLGAHNSFRIRTSTSVHSKDLKILWNQHLQKTRGEGSVSEGSVCKMNITCRPSILLLPSCPPNLTAPIAFPPLSTAGV